MSSSKPSVGQKIRIDKKNESIIVPDHPIIPFIEGDGTGPDIWRAPRSFSTPPWRRHIKARGR